MFFWMHQRCFAQSVHIKIRISKSKRVVDKSHITKKGMDGFCSTYLLFGLCRTKKVMLHYEYAKTNDSSKLR